MIGIVHTEIAPSTIAPPAANYALGVVTSGAARWLHTSGIVPTRPDGTVPDSVADQADVVWANLLAILTEADMVATDVVSITTYVVIDHIAELSTVMAARDRALGGHRAASTLVTVPGLARPAWKLEIAIVAAG
jgi:enamine deaminase RidA (YjgF/YER057c/UK114 family)